MSNVETKSVPVPPSTRPGRPPEPAPPRRRFAWQPLTPRGVAEFASAKFGRVFAVQCGFAALIVAVVVWLLLMAVTPVIGEALGQLPDQGEVRNGQLVLPRSTIIPLAEGHRLAVLVDLENNTAENRGRDLQIQFHRHEIKFCSLFGCLSVAYPRGYVMPFNRIDLASRWGAWKPALLAGAALAVFVGLLATWFALAAGYAVIVRAFAFYADRPLSWGGSCRLSAAALLPGAMFFTAALALYGLGLIDLIRLLVAWPLHLMVGWCYLVAAPLTLSRKVLVPPPPANPFASKKVLDEAQ